MQDKQACIAYYDQAAATYDKDRFACPCRALVDRLFKDTAFDMVGHADTILDAGTGTGRFARRLASEGRQVIAVDAAEAMLETARQNAEREGLADNIRFVQGDIEDIPIGDASVDAITCIHVLVHYERIDQVVREFARVLKPGGCVVFELASSRVAKLYNRLWRLAVRRDYFSYRDYYRSFGHVRRILEDNGLIVERVKRVKKVPKVVLHLLMCKCRLKPFGVLVRWIERCNFGFVAILCVRKPK